MSYTYPQALELNADAPEERRTWFANVILPVPIPKMFTYRVPVALESIIQPGCRVVVQFGSKKILTGVVGNLHNNPPSQYQARYLLELLDETPVVNPVQLQLFQWIADYYVCTAGEVLNMALPSGLKLSSESKIQLHPEFRRAQSEYEFTDKEYRVLDELEVKQTLSYPEVGNLLNEKSFYQTIKSLIGKEAVLIFEEVKEKYKPKIIKRIRLATKYVQDPASLEHLFAELERKPRQADVILHYMQLLPAFRNPETNNTGVLKSKLSERDISVSSINTLVKKGVLEESEEVVSRFAPVATEPSLEIKLTEAQQVAKDAIHRHFQQQDIVLLHGITGSGKTEIYMDLIQEVLSSGSQVLYLLPEIALTTQIVSRLSLLFGNQMGIYHSRFSDNERVEVWQGVLDGRFPLVVGVRSATLLPFDNLGLIIVDEEHETSYKQFDPAPRYHARDVALMLGKFHHAKTLLGSATPAVETYYHAKHGKYGLVKLTQRYGNAQLPDIELVDIKEERKRKTMKQDFSSALLESMEAILQNCEQAIIFQNRRGYAPYIYCEDCAHIPKCQQCDVSLTYHQYANELRCHYCGLHEKMHTCCVACGSTRLRTSGFGTEKLEEEINALLPQSRVQRMDLDTTRKKNSYQQIIDRFAQGDLDFLVGTQMVSKGLDFDRVCLVGVLDADRMIHFPDFRSHERTFQLITQVSGRSGRRDKVGKVLIQTTNLKQPILHKIISNDYTGLYEEEIAEREVYHYPPFVRLIKITVKHQDKRISQQAGATLVGMLQGILGNHRVLGPEEPLISRIRNQYLVQLMIKLERGLNLPEVKQKIRQQCQELNQEKTFRQAKIVIDVDPY